MAKSLQNTTPAESTALSSLRLSGIATTVEVISWFNMNQIEPFPSAFIIINAQVGFAVIVYLLITLFLT